MSESRLKISSIISVLSLLVLGGIVSVDATHEEFLGVPVPHKESDDVTPIQDELVEEDDSTQDELAEKDTSEDELVEDLLAAQSDFFNSIFSNQSDDDSPQCDWFKITEGCDFPSGLDILISIFIGVYLAIVIHMMARHQQQKLEINSEKVQANTIRLEKMLTSQENMRIKRRDFAIQSFKNYLNSLLFTLSSINDSVTSYSEEKKSKTFLGGAQSSNIHTRIKNEEEIKQRLTQTMRNTIIYSSDVLDPILVSKIDELCTIVGQMHIIENESEIFFSGFEEARQAVKESSEMVEKIFVKIQQESQSETESEETE